MRLVITVVVILVFVAAGVVFGALNAAMVPFDFGFARVQVPKGAAVLAALVVGWLLGGIVAWLGTGVARRRRASGTRAGSASAASSNEP